MIRKVLFFLFVSSLLQAGYCWKIKNKDQKALCESKFEKKKSCWLIKNSDLRAYCEATAYHQNSCWKIKNNDTKVMCEAEVNYKK